MKAIRNAVVDELKKLCQCPIDSDHFDKESLACFKNASNLVTYQAWISGTAEKTSSFLVSRLQNWVSEGHMIRVGGVLLKVGENCLKMSASNLSSEFCPEQMLQIDTCTCTFRPSIATIVGPIGFVLVVIVVILVIAVIVVLGKRKQKFSLQKEW